MAYLILSLDGGGIRGVLTAALLDQIEQAQPFLERVQLFAGTSTGGILALGLASGMTPAELVTLYQKHGERIFGKRDVWDTVAGGADEVYRADYDTRGVKGVLEGVFGKRRLSELPKQVLIPTFDLEGPGNPKRWKPKFLHNYPGPSSDGDTLIVDAAVRTSAAPTYFPSYQGYIDGGVVANNPSMCAVAKAVKAGQPLSDIRLLSIGTGFNPHLIAGDEHDWGKAQWGLRIIKLVLEGTPDVAHYQCDQLLAQRYCRLQVELEDPIGLDDTSAIGKLVDLARQADTSEAARFVTR